MSCSVTIRNDNDIIIELRHCGRGNVITKFNIVRGFVRARTLEQELQGKFDIDASTVCTFAPRELI